MTCGIIFPKNNSSDPVDLHGCMLANGHKGPHTFKAEDGIEYNWETDYECDCSHCMQFYGDYCTVYWEAEPTMNETPDRA